MGDSGRGRRLPVGAEVWPGGVHFRVWAPRRKRVEVVIDRQPGEQGPAYELAAEESGYFSGLVASASAGTLYRFRLDGEESFPDPASRFQPLGPHGPSQVLDPASFPWTDRDWPGIDMRGQVLYEMHIGAFTREGTWEAASRELPYLRKMGITVIEMMPVADFPGRFGWGYDGVNLFAPTQLYGLPDDLRRFINKAHELGLGVILDVVYNHLGPDGNYLGQYSYDYVTVRYETAWGDAINFDGENSGMVREFFASNAACWIEEYHFDGLRLDATQNIYDSSGEHVLAAINRRAREAAGGRKIILIAENESQEARHARPTEKGGYGLDAIWNDDFHHSAIVAVTGRNEAYYENFLGTPQELISSVKRGFLYQGQRYRWETKRRGTPSLDLDPQAFVTFVENHDQVSNSSEGKRLHQVTDPGRYRAITALLLLAPSTPLLFQGQEFAATSPFPFFADHEEWLSKLIREGRAKFLDQFRSLATDQMRELIPDPSDPATFERAKLDLTERERNKGAVRLHADLLRLRREDPVFSAQKRGGVDGAVLGREAFLLRFFGAGDDDRLLIVNLGRDLRLDPVPEPLLAPPEDGQWEIIWSSEDPRYGGTGSPPLDTEEGWLIPGHAAVALK